MSEIDQLLREMTEVVNANIGLDSTASEKAEAKKRQGEMLKRIKEIDFEFFKSIALDEFGKYKVITVK